MACMLAGLMILSVLLIPLLIRKLNSTFLYVWGLITLLWGISILNNHPDGLTQPFLVMGWGVAILGVLWAVERAEQKNARPEPVLDRLPRVGGGTVDEEVFELAPTAGPPSDPAVAKAAAPKVEDEFDPFIGEIVEYVPVGTRRTGVSGDYGELGYIAIRVQPAEFEYAKRMGFPVMEMPSGELIVLLSCAGDIGPRYGALSGTRLEVEPFGNRMAIYTPLKDEV